MRTIQSRASNCCLRAIVALACFSLGLPSAAGQEKDDLTKEEQNAVKWAFSRLPGLRTLDDSEIKKKVAESARKYGTLPNLGPLMDQMRSAPRVGYRVYGGLFMPGDHYLEGKLLRTDDGDFLGSCRPHMKAALTKKHGQPERGPKFEWMKVKSHLEVEERCHWNIKATIMHEGEPVEIRLTCELTFLKNKDLVNSLIVSLMDTERAEWVSKALGRK